MSQAGFSVRPAVAADAVEIAAMIREAFPPRLVGAMIYGCPGIARFVAEQIRVQEQGGETYYAVASDGHGVVGCAETRRLPGRLFLSYIAVRSAFRTRGLGRQLLRAAIEAGDAGAKEFALDVFDFNTAARQWYRQLGFEHRESVSWWQASLGQCRRGPVSLAGYAQAEACHREFGFSQFSVSAAGSRYDVGRLGRQWYRLTDPAAVAAPGLLAVLKRLSPERRLLLPVKARPRGAPLFDVNEIARSHRLAAPLESLRQRLSGGELEYGRRG